MRIIIAGSRPPKAIRADAQALEQWYEEHYDVLDAAIDRSGWRELIDCVIEGEAEGWDTLGKRWAMLNGVTVEPYPAKWRRKDGTVDMGAGHKRNKVMAEVGDCLLAMWDGKSHGTRNMIATAEKEWGGYAEAEARIRVELVEG
jgi:hypothetical protein